MSSTLPHSTNEPSAGLSPSRLPLIGWVARALLDFARLLREHRLLIFEMTRRALVDQHAGQVLGRIWAVCHPLMFAGIYILVFAFVFKSQFGGTADLPLDRPAFILAGLVPWLGMIRSMSLSASSLISGSNLVKQVVFPIEVLPVKDVLASFFGQLVSLLALVVYVLAKYGELSFSYLWLPVLLVMQFAFLCGVAFVLSALTPFFRDLRELVTVFAQIGIFTLPIIFVPPVSPVVEAVLHINPFSYPVWCYQDALFYGRIDHPLAWGVFAGMSLIGVAVGLRVFQRMKIIVGNVL